MREHTIRATGSVVIWAIGAVIGAAALVDIAVGDVPGFWHALAPILLALWALGMVLARPVIRYGAEGVEIVNPGVVTTASWTAVVSVERGLQLMVTLADGRRVTAWGSPALPRRSARRPGRHPRPSLPTYDDADWSLAELDRAREGGSHSGRPARAARRPDVPALAVGVVLLVATIVTFAL